MSEGTTKPAILSQKADNGQGVSLVNTLRPIMQRSTVHTANLIKMDAQDVGLPLVPSNGTTSSTQEESHNKSNDEEPRDTFKCPQCAKSFVRRKHLNRHIKSHSGHRPYLCPVTTCSRSTFGFGRADSLKYHVNTVHSEDRAATSAKITDDTSMATTSSSTAQTTASSADTPQTTTPTARDGPSIRALGKRKMDESDNELESPNLTKRHNPGQPPVPRRVSEQVPEDKVTSLQLELEKEKQMCQELGRWYEEVLAQLKHAKKHHETEMVNQQERYEALRDEHNKAVKEKERSYQEREERLWMLIRKE